MIPHSGPDTSGLDSARPASLAELGWNAFFDSHRHRLASHHVAGRVAADRGESLVVLTCDGPVVARASGRLRHGAASPLDLPAVGDWVGLRLAERGHGVVEVVLPRAAKLVRQAAGTRVLPQVVAANVDLVAVVMALGHDFNARRLERYLAVVEQGGAMPLVVLSKADLCEDVESSLVEARRVARGAPILALSAVTGDGLDGLRAHLRPGLTLAAVGSSGAGKSTLVNALLGRDAQKTGEVREHDGRGRHVTSHRELFVVPGGALCIDTPGMRELSAWAEGDSSLFDDIDDLAATCRFRDCRHAGEPGCEVERAIAEDRLDAGRLESHRKLQKELAFQERRQDERLRAAEQARWKSITRSMRGFTKEGR